MSITRHSRFLLSTIVAIALLGGCGAKEGAKSGDPTNEKQGTEAVRVMALQFREVDQVVSYSAQLLAINEVHLAPAAPGRITRIHVEAGQHFSKGQLLVEMDKTQLLQAEVQLRGLETDYRRVDTLRRVGSISEYEYDRVKTQYEVTKANVDFLRENTTLRAPFSGTVSGKYFESGELYSGAPNTSAGKAAILSLVNASRLKALVHVAERFYPLVRKGMRVAIRTEVYPDREFTGTVAMIYPTIDAATRTFIVEIVVPNPDGVLRPGMFARADLALGRTTAFLAPALAVMKLQGSNERSVFIEKDGVAHRVVVTLGERHDDMVELISDKLHPGDRLIVAGQSKLMDQAPVRVQQ